MNQVKVKIEKGEDLHFSGETEKGTFLSNGQWCIRLMPGVEVSDKETSGLIKAGKPFERRNGSLEFLKKTTFDMGKIMIYPKGEGTGNYKQVTPTLTAKYSEYYIVFLGNTE